MIISYSPVQRRKIIWDSANEGTFQGFPAVKMGRTVTPSTSEYAYMFQRPAALRDIRKEYDDDELKRSTHKPGMSIAIRPIDISVYLLHTYSTIDTNSP